MCLVGCICVPCMGSVYSPIRLRFVPLAILCIVLLYVSLVARHCRSLEGLHPVERPFSSKHSQELSLVSFCSFGLCHLRYLVRWVYSIHSPLVPAEMRGSVSEGGESQALHYMPSRRTHDGFNRSGHPDPCGCEKVGCLDVISCSLCLRYGDKPALYLEKEWVSYSSVVVFALSHSS